MSFLQAIVLLLFNAAEKMSFVSIKDLTRIGKPSLSGSAWGHEVDLHGVMKPACVDLHGVMKPSLSGSAWGHEASLSGSAWGHEASLSGSGVMIPSTEDGELRRTLQSLAIGNARVLIKHPKVGEGGYSWVG